MRAAHCQHRYPEDAGALSSNKKKRATARLFFLLSENPLLFRYKDVTQNEAMLLRGFVTSWLRGWCLQGSIPYSAIWALRTERVVIMTIKASDVAAQIGCTLGDLRGRVLLAPEWRDFIGLVFDGAVLVENELPDGSYTPRWQPAHYSVEGSPRARLGNGLVVANFSSPHTFTFVDGTVVPACSPERARSLMLKSVETEMPHPSGVEGVIDLQLDWEVTDSVLDALAKLEADPRVDIILVPFPVMTALKNADIPANKARVIRVADRVTKEIHTHRFCR